jgi:hypothetical protein
MGLKKMFVVIIAAMAFATPALAGNYAEFDAVDCDATNYFAARDIAQHVQVINNNIGPNGPINFFSYFPGVESFSTTAGQLFPDPCFPGYVSALTDVWNEAQYTWRIVLQMKPESDIDLNIKDCVLKHNEGIIPPDTVWTTGSFEQTGRYRAADGQLFFVPSANPVVTATAYPGPYATPGFPSSGIIMDARTLPGLALVALDEALYTSKALWYEGIVMALPETGGTNASGQATFNLKQGDVIEVVVDIPGNNTADIRYGRDNVILKYIGIVGTWYYSAILCTGG